MTHTNKNYSVQNEAKSEATRPILPWASSDTIFPFQLRAARGLLDWGRNECGKATCLSPETIKNIESGAFKPHATTRGSIIEAFKKHGVEFLNLLNLRLHTLSGNELDMVVDVAGVVLVIPKAQPIHAEVQK